MRRVAGTSMLPTLRPGQVVVAWPCHTVAAGDIVIVRHENIEKIKRVVRLQDGRLFLAGDNAAASTDSRTFGWVDAEEVLLGRVVWPRPAGH